MKWMMTLTTLSLIGIVFTGNSIYTELKLYKSNKKPTEISASMYRSLIWHSDVYKDNVFLYTAEQYFSDGIIDTSEYIKLNRLAKETSGPLIFIQQDNEQLWHARLAYKQYLEVNALTQVATLD